MAKVSIIPHVLLLIDRDASTKIPVKVPEYEQQILEEIYGEELVHEVEAEDMEVEGFDIQKAFDGLVSKYQGTPDGDRARKLLYPKVRDLEKRLGIKASAPAKSAKPAKEQQPDDAGLLDGTVADITAGLASLSDDELEALDGEEAAREKPRKGVHDAIEAERTKRAANQ